MCEATDRFNSDEDLVQTPLQIAKDIIYSDSTPEQQVQQIEIALMRFAGGTINDVKEALGEIFEHIQNEVNGAIEGAIKRNSRSNSEETN